MEQRRRYRPCLLSSGGEDRRGRPISQGILISVKRCGKRIVQKRTNKKKKKGLAAGGGTRREIEPTTKTKEKKKKQNTRNRKTHTKKINRHRGRG